MLKNEAIWFGRTLQNIPKKRVGKALDLGGESFFFRHVRQAFINTYIFRPLRRRGVEIIHTDIDLDVASNDFAGKVKRIGFFQTVFACNLLEHVKDYKKAAKNIVSIIQPGGYLFVSCPKDFPRHPNPIDNGFRPTPEELAGLFPNTKIIAKAMITQKFKIIITKKGLLFGKNYSASCLVLRIN